MGNREWGIGHWALGNGQWALGNGHARIKQAAVSDARSNRILSMPHALCPMPYAQCPIYLSYPLPRMSHLKSLLNPS
jgi:hypothetical protein